VKPIVQVSLDLTDIKEAMEMAHTAMRAGVDWLEAGTPFILAEGLHGVRALRKEFPNTPVVADLKTMDGRNAKTMTEGMSRQCDFQTRELKKQFGVAKECRIT
jgi:3-keto-L-gulonate-6-phosphate decarboxylase